MKVEQIFQWSWDWFSKKFNFIALVAALALAALMILGGSTISFLLGSTIATGVALEVVRESFGYANLQALGAGGFLLFSVSGLVLLSMLTYVVGAMFYAANLVASNKNVSAWNPFSLALGRYFNFFLLGLFVTIILSFSSALFIIPGVIAFIFLSFAFYLVVAENLDSVGAMTRSVELVRDNFVPVLTVLFVLFLINFVVNSIFIAIPIIGWYAIILTFMFSAIVLAATYKQISSKKRK